jgi:hypothetical protein
MSLIETHWIGAVTCDKRGCDTEVLLSELIPAYGAQSREAEAAWLRDGWVIRVGRSRTWFCPDHAHLAYRCIKGTYRCSRWCPVHEKGRVVDNTTAASR